MVRVGREADWPGADAWSQEAQAILAELDAIGSAAPDTSSRDSGSLSLADRFDTVLDSGRKIASALAASAIHEAARAAALRMLRGEHCLVLQIEDVEHGKQRILADQSGISVNAAFVERAIDAGRAVACTEEQAPGAGASAAESGERSVLCVPIRVRGRIVACLYVTHEHVRELFGADEERLADFIATITGAVLENAEGFAELQQLNESLEQRVADRTAAAESRARTGRFEPGTGTNRPRIATSRGTAARREANRRKRQPGQEPLLGHDEPRNSDPDERRIGHDRVGAEYPAQ